MVELLATDTGVGPFAAAGDSATAKHSVLLGHTATMADPSGFGCTVVAMQTTPMVQPASVVVTE